MSSPGEIAAPSERCQVIQRLCPEATATACTLADGGTVLVSPYVAGYLRPGDEIRFSLPMRSLPVELHVSRSRGPRPRDLYLAPIGYVTQPKQDKREEHYLVGEIAGGRLGVRAIHLPANTVRDYFYRGDRKKEWADSPTLYEVLRTTPTVRPGDLRLAYKLRRLELEAQNAPASSLRDTERAFNLLMQHELRSCYDALLANPETPALFPFGGFGSLLVAGDLSRSRDTFFAQRILSFLPERRRLRFRAPLRRVDFLQGHAVYRDSRRKMEAILDPIILPLTWDPTWNQWKHLLGVKIGVDAECVAAGKYRFRGGEWQLVSWLSALPSRIQLSLPADIDDQVTAARRIYHRFGQYSAALEGIRLRLQREPLERRQLDTLCSQLGIPGDFDVAKISWKPDYDAFFYDQIRKRARNMYLFREEYIFIVEHAIVVERPEVGHATYVFAKPDDIEGFVRAYAMSTKDDIRRNRDGVAERLRFLGRIMHGSNPRTWLAELKNRVGETGDYSLSVTSVNLENRHAPSQRQTE